MRKISEKELTIRQMGEFCTAILCKNCPIKKWNDESGLHNGCMESMRLPEVSELMLRLIKNRRIDYDRY